MLSIKKILHPTDFSDISDYVFELACSLAVSTGARIHVLHVAKANADYAASEQTENYYEMVMRKLHQLAARDPKIPVEPQIVCDGDPAAEILRVARAIEADLIVMGTHGPKRLERLFVGSIAEEVFYKAPCPVVVVKAPTSGPTAHRE